MGPVWGPWGLGARISGLGIGLEDTGFFAFGVNPKTPNWAPEPEAQSMRPGARSCTKL